MSSADVPRQQGVTARGKCEEQDEPAFCSDFSSAHNPVQKEKPSAILSPVELKEQLFAPTLAVRLGDVPHVSGLLRRLAQVSGAGESIGDWLLKAAVTRGASHYRRAFDPALPPDVPAFSDEEIGIALCLGQHVYDLDKLRAAAQLLSSPRVNAVRLAKLTVEERCEPVLGHIATLAERFAPELEPWAWLRQHLPRRPVPRADALPHWSRLVSHTGVTAHSGPPRTDWLCRDE
jgi:hypothetical protein